LILGGSDTYTGSTTVAAGKLIVTTASAFPAGTSLTIVAGGTFVFDPAYPSGSPVVGSLLNHYTRSCPRIARRTGQFADQIVRVLTLQ
jgi:autotransporter-associated beta strand protein